MKKGFTLIEMIAVIAIMGLITALVLPNLVNQFNNKKNDISEASKNLIYSATELYMGDDSSNYPQIKNNVYCIKLEDLVKGGYLEKPLKDIQTNKEIPLDKKIKVSFNEYNEPLYELNDKNECNQKFQPNYGTKLEYLYEDLYSNMSPSTPVTPIDNNDDYYDGNYKYPRALAYQILNNGSSHELISSSPRASASGYTRRGIVYNGTNSYELARATNLNRWIFFRIAAGGGTTDVKISNFKLNFADGSSLTLNEAVNSKYIEPLVVVSSSSRDDIYLWENTHNIITGGETAIGYFPNIIVVLKVKDKSALKGYTLTTNTAWSSSYDGVHVEEFAEETEISTEPLG